MMRWKASEVLQINDTSSCAGYSYSRRRPCNSHLSSAKTGPAEYLLSCLSYDLINSDDAVDGDLRNFARFPFCTPRHENQAGFLIETWKRWVLWFQRVQMVQNIQEWESMLEDVTVRLGRSSLSVAQPSGNNGLNENRPAQLREHYAVHSHTASSSTGQPFTALRADNYVSSDLALDHARNLDGPRYDGPETYASTSLSDYNIGITLLHYQLSVRRVGDGNPQIDTLEYAKRDCPVCLTVVKSWDGDWSCNGCLTIFHDNCTYKWVKQCREWRVNGTCPCWLVFCNLSQLATTHASLSCSRMVLDEWYEWGD